MFAMKIYAVGAGELGAVGLESVEEAALESEVEPESEAESDAAPVLLEDFDEAAESFLT